MKGANITFDPRTKLLLLLTMGIFVLGSAGGNLFDAYMPLFCAVPVVLFVLDGKWKRAVLYAVLYGAAYALLMEAVPRLSGIGGYILLACCGILTRFLPGIMTGAYLMQTTKVSEFHAAMERMHVTDKITIPLSVCSGFFPPLRMSFLPSMTPCACVTSVSAGKMWRRWWSTG